MVYLIASALAATLPVAVQDLAPGTPVDASHLRWVEVPDGATTDALVDPVDQIVVDRVLEGEIFRAERLLDLEKPERIAVPGMRAFRVPMVDPAVQPGHRADLWLGLPTPCTQAQGAWVLGLGRDVDGRIDSTYILVPPQVALAALAHEVPMQLRPVSDATANKTRPEIACSL